VGIAGKTVNRTVAQVSRYLTDESIRETAQNGVLGLIDEQTRVVIGHSLGSVVAFEALHRAHQPVAFITMGSPLGLRTIVYDRLRPQPPHVPACLTSWHNSVDKDDLIAAHLDLAPFFPPAPGLEVAPITAQSLDCRLPA
jgi:hypothetical protein